ncbi:MAG: diguanylate cyclase [Gammaproteobacteria bacterium]
MTSSATAGLAVLVADDNPINRELAVAMLEALGHCAVPAGDADDAVAAVARGGLDIVFLDCELAPEDGCAAVRRIRQAQAGGGAESPLPIVAIAAGDADRERCLAAGMDDCLVRPLSAAGLRAILERWMPPAAPAPAPEPDAPVIDAAVLRELRTLQAPGSPDLVALVLQTFADSAPGTVAALAAAVAAADARAAFIAAHSLKSAAAQIGARTLSQRAAALERGCRDGSLDGVDEAVRGIKDAFAAVCATLESDHGIRPAGADTAPQAAPAPEDAPAPAQDPPVPWSDHGHAAGADSQACIDPPAEPVPPAESLAPAPPGATADVDLRAAPIQVEAALDSVVEDRTGARPRILVVDDDAGPRAIAARMLGEAGYEVDLAAGGEAALARLDAQRPDLVLLDVIMPGMDGYDVCEAIRARADGELLPVVMVTGLDDLSAVERAFQVRATDFVRKPIEWPVLLHRLRYLLRGAQAMARLHRSQSRNRALLAAIPDVILRLTREGRILDYKPDPGVVSLAAPEDFVGREVLDLLPRSLANAVVRAVEQAVDRAGGFAIEHTVARHEGSHVYECRVVGSSAAEAIVLIRDVTERAAAQALVRKLSQAVEQSPSGVAIVGVDGAIAYANRRFEELTGCDLERLRQRPWLAEVDATGDAGGMQALRDAVHAGREWSGEIHARRDDGEVYWALTSVSPVLDAAGRVEHVIANFQDITERKQREDRVRFLAYYDQLTGLPNRRLFEERLDAALAEAERRKHLVAVLFVDLDHFKRVNDTLGHRVGDELLKKVAERIGECVRTGDSVARIGDDPTEHAIARLGGDEFTVVLPDVKGAADAGRVAQRLLEQLALPFFLNGREVFFSASVGITVYPFDGADAAALIKNADAAMYRAKTQGRNGFEYYARSMSDEAVRRLDLEARLRKAIEHGELMVHYQPQIDIASGRITAVEALVRWRHPELGVVSPAEFIPIAEDSGLIVPIGRWVLENACRHGARWNQNAAAPVRIAVNLSVRQFRDRTLKQQVADSLAAAGLDPALLEIVFTECVLIEDTAGAVAALREF